MGEAFLGIGQLGQEVRLVGPEFASVLGFGARNGIADLLEPKRCGIELLLVCRTHDGWGLWRSYAAGQDLASPHRFSGCLPVRRQEAMTRILGIACRHYPFRASCAIPAGPRTRNPC